MAKTKQTNQTDQTPNIPFDIEKALGTNRHLSHRPSASRDIPPRQERASRSIGKMLHSFSIDGVSMNNSGLLQRQYDDSHGAVDPASDIHTDKHLLMDALMRRNMTTGTSGSSSTTEPNSVDPSQNAE